MSARAGQKVKPNSLDYPLVVVVIALTIVGLIAVWATSIPDALKTDSDPLRFVVNQLKWLAVGMLGAIVAYRIGYRFLAKVSFFLLLGALGLLILVQARGELINGSTRWLNNGSIQPSELAKPAIIVYLAYWLSSKGEKLHSRDTGLIPFTILVGVCVALILVQPDFSTAVLLAAVALIMFLMAGAALKEVAGLLGAGAVMAGVLIAISGYRWRRILDYIAGNNSDAGNQRQMVQSLADSAGVLGHGLDSVQTSASQLTGAHTDFIFSFITYGFGVAVALLLLAAFLFLGYRTARIARRAPDALGMLTSVGLGSWLLLQALVHIAVSVGAIPVTGLTLPFVSYGGSSLVVCLASIGVLLSISQDRSSETKHSAVYSYGGRDRRPRISKPDRRTGSARSSARR